MIFVPAGRPAVEKLRQSRSLLDAMCPTASVFAGIAGAVAGVVVRLVVLRDGHAEPGSVAVLVVVPTISFAVAVCSPSRKPARPWKSSRTGWCAACSRSPAAGRAPCPTWRRCRRPGPDRRHRRARSGADDERARAGLDEEAVRQSAPQRVRACCTEPARSGGSGRRLPVPANAWNPSIGQDSHGRFSSPIRPIANALKLTSASGDGRRRSSSGARIAANVAVDLIALECARHPRASSSGRRRSK